eukprot:GHVS01009555.1.p1 GENE.GHVS01009555.1~~GHVS01009555.1.p1  ORF type:complete len:173 (+),score=4.86 GHVS01009555.1:328-846(+)
MYTRISEVRSSENVRTKFSKQHIDAVEPFVMNDSTTQRLVSYMEIVTAHTVSDTVATGSTLSEKTFLPSTHGSVSERLRRWTRNPLGFPRAGSNPAAVASSLAQMEGLCADVHRRSLSIICTDAVCLSSAQTQSVYHLHRRSLSIICTDASALDGSIQNLFASFATFSSSEN